MTDYALTVARIIERERPTLGDLDTWPEPWPDLARVGLAALDGGDDPRKAIERAIDASNGDQPAIRELLYTAARQILTEPEPVPEVPDCLPLPEGVQPNPALGIYAGRWVDLYSDYAAAISPMTPGSFHESAALWLGSVAIARRLVLPMFFGKVYPNLFVCWMATTTLYRKTTALDVARKLARQALGHLMAAQDTTPEAFLSDLAGREPSQFDALIEQDRADWTKGRDYAAQKGWLLDEMSGLMAGAGKDYNAGLVEALLRFYDCDPYYVRSTRGQGRVVVRNSYLSLLGCSTPAAMAQHLTAERLWSMGWWPRFAILTPELGRPPWQVARDEKEPAELAPGLARLYERLPPATWPKPPETRAAALGAGVYEAWERYNKAVGYDLLTDDLDERLKGTYGRLPSLALKVGLILAALDLDGWEGKNTPTVELAHLSRAISICEQWRVSAHRALAMATTTDFDRTQERILRQCGRYMPEGPTLRDLYKSMKDKDPWQIEETVIQLIKLGLVQEVEWQNPKGGPKTKRYPLV